MRRHSRKKTVCLLSIFGGVALLAKAADPESDRLPDLDEYSAKGLQIQCTPAKENFVVGEPLHLRCVVTNTTESVKPVAWNPFGGSYLIAKDEASWSTGTLPQVMPELRDPIKIRSSWHGYVLFLPPHSSLQLILTSRAGRPGKTKGIIVYDPVIHGGGFFGAEALEKAKQACVFSNTFEYEVTNTEKK